jgi:hypothetical protein
MLQVGRDVDLPEKPLGAEPGRELRPGTFNASWR